jgi:hypothetical protein
MSAVCGGIVAELHCRTATEAPRRPVAAIEVNLAD